MIEPSHNSSSKPLLLFKFPKLMQQQTLPTNKEDHVSLDQLFHSVSSLYSEMRFYRYLPGRIVFLIGTSSAGKSSIVKYIQENSTTSHDQLVFTGTDYIWNDLMIKRFLNQAPYDMIFLLSKINDTKKLIEYIYEPEKFIISEYYVILELEDTIKIKEILVKLNNIRYTMGGILWEWYQYCSARAIIPALAQGKTIIIDTVELPSFFEMLNAPFHLIKCKIDTVVVYCHPQKLEQHIMQRNIASIKHLIAGTRFFFPFEGYDEIYTTTKNNNLAIDQIKLSDIQSIDPSAKAACLREYILELLAQDMHPSRNKIRQTLLSEIDIIVSESSTSQNIDRQQFLIKKWLPNNITSTYIKPNFSYQMIINSGVLNAVECGQKLLTIIDKPSVKNINRNTALLTCKMR